MNKALVIRAIKFSLIFMTAFLILNLLTMKKRLQYRLLLYELSLQLLFSLSFISLYLQF